MTCPGDVEPRLGIDVPAGGLGPDVTETSVPRRSHTGPLKTRQASLHLHEARLLADLLTPGVMDPPPSMTLTHFHEGVHSSKSFALLLKTAD